MYRKTTSTIACFFLFVTFSFAQVQKVTSTNINPVRTEKASLEEQVFALQKQNKDLQQQLTDLKTQLASQQTQINANYKVLDYSLGKVMKTAPTAFIVVAGADNLTDAFKPATDYLPGNYYRSVIIDDPSCNGKPDAVVVVTLQPSNFGYNLPTGFSVKYDAGIGKWKLSINPNISNPSILGLAKPASGANMVSVPEYYPYQINNGDKFNVIVVK